MIDDNRRPDQGRRKRIGLVLLTAGPSRQHQTPEETGRLEGEHPDGQRSGLAEVAAADAANQPGAAHSRPTQECGKRE
jgi:hypothetical protein